MKTVRVLIVLYVLAHRISSANVIWTDQWNVSFRRLKTSSAEDEPCESSSQANLQTTLNTILFIYTSSPRAKLHFS